MHINAHYGCPLMNKGEFLRIGKILEIWRITLGESVFKCVKTYGKTFY
jgi:hypothetical protein